MTKNKKIPRFKSDKEAAEFWDTHSSADYWDQMKDVTDQISFSRSPTRKVKERAKKINTKNNQRKKLQKEISIGIRQANSGELEPLNITKIKAEVRKKRTQQRPRAYRKTE